MSDLADEAVYQDSGKCLELLRRCYIKADDARRPYEARWTRAWRIYHSQHDKKMLEEMYGSQQWPFESSLFLPWAKEQVEANVPRLVLGLTTDDMPFRVAPLLTDARKADESEWSNACAEVHSLLCNQLYEHVQFPAQIEHWARAAEILGTVILFLDWWRERDGDEQIDQIRARMLSPLDCYPDPRGTCIHKWEMGQPIRYLQIVLRETLDSIWRLIEQNQGKRWEITSKAQLETLLGRMRGEHDKQRSLSADVGNIASAQGAGYSAADDEDRRLIPLLLHFEQDRCIWAAGVPPHATILLKEIGVDYPYAGVGIPAVRFLTNSVPFEFWGNSTVLDVAPLNHAANYMLNCALTNAYRSVNQTVLYDANAELDQLVAQPTGTYKVQPPARPDSAVHVIPWPNNLKDFTTYHNIFDVETQKIGTAPDLMQGMTGSTPDTARGTLALMGEINTKYRQKARTARQCLTGLGRVMWTIDKKFITEATLIPLFGDRDAKLKIASFGAEHFKRRFTIKFDSRDRATNQGLRIQQMQSWMAMHQQDPKFPMREADWRMAKLLEIEEPSAFLGQESTHEQAENGWLLQYGYMPPVRPTDNHEKHLAAHQDEAFIEQVKRLPPAQQIELEYHIQDHITLLTGVSPTMGMGGGAGEEMNQGGAGAPEAAAMDEGPPPGMGMGQDMMGTAPGVDAGIAPEQTDLSYGGPVPTVPQGGLPGV